MLRSEPSMRYLIRLMTVLLTQDAITVTNLAMLSRMNHKRCSDLVKLIALTGYLKTRENGNKKYVFLTESGKEYATRLVDLNRLNASLYA